MVVLWIIFFIGIMNIISRLVDDKCNRKKFVGDFWFLLYSKVMKNVMFFRVLIRKIIFREMME